MVNDGDGVQPSQNPVPLRLCPTSTPDHCGGSAVPELRRSTIPSHLVSGGLKVIPLGHASQIRNAPWTVSSFGAFTVGQLPCSTYASPALPRAYAATPEVFRESAVANARAGYPRNESLREMAVELIATFEPSNQHQPGSTRINQHPATSFRAALTTSPLVITEFLQADY